MPLDADFRPLAAGELLDRSFGIYRRLFTPLLLIQLLCVAPLLPFQLYLVASGRERSPLYFLLVLASFVLSALASAATARLISESYLGREERAGTALRGAVPMIGPLLLVSLGLGLVLMLSAMPAMLMMAGGAVVMVAAEGSGGGATSLLLTLAGFALLVLPVAAFAALSVATPALIIERIGAGAALSRSWALTRGSRLRVVGILLVVLVLIMIPFIGLGLLAAMLGLGGGTEGQQSVLVLVLTYVVSILLTPWFYGVLTLLYYDFRVRREGFDLEMLAQQLGEA